MSEPPQPKRRSRGFFRRQMRAGDPVRKPLAEWAYATPRYPGGLVVSDLCVASEGIQRETALAWFAANLKPYELGAGPWFGFGGPFGAGFNSAPFNTVPFNAGGPKLGGFGQGQWAPAPLRANAVLREQFEGVIPDALVQSLGATLGDSWMWIDPEAPVQLTDGAASLTSGLQADLDAVEDIIRGLVPEHGGIGHNALEGEGPLTPTEQAEALVAIGQIRKALAPESGRAEEMKAGADRLVETRDKLGRWLLGQADTFITESNKAIAKKTPYLLLAGLGWHQLGDLLTQLFHHLARI